MPGGDRTGPMGMGAMTGRGAGFCSGSDNAGYTRAMPGRGFGMGAGRGGGFRRTPGGRGWRNQYFATGMPGWMRSGPYTEPGVALDKEALRQQSQFLQSQLDSIKKRLDEME